MTYDKPDPLKVSILFDSTIDGIVDNLPSADQDLTLFLSVDKKIYFSLESCWYSYSPQKWSELVVRSTGDHYIFNGDSLILSPDTGAEIVARLVVVEEGLASLGTASQKDTEFFVSSDDLLQTIQNIEHYTDEFREGLRDSINMESGASLVGYYGRTVSSRLQDTLNLKDFGAMGDGVVDDSIAFNTATAKAITLNKALFIPAGVYILTSPSTLTGRIFIYGNSDVTLVGSVTYQCLTFPASADGGVGVQLTPISPFFGAKGINFKSITSQYALTVIAQVGTKFIDTAQIIDCKFYGDNGFNARNLITATLAHCYFYNNLVGMKTEGCTNWSVSFCNWRNCVNIGAYVTYNTTNPSRKGGENLRFSHCEWACCATGLYLDRHMWASLDSCLFDYCALPLKMRGSIEVKASKTYFGAATVSSILANPAYVPPSTLGVALYLRPYIDGNNIEAGGISCDNCEFVNYTTGSSQPLVYMDGFNVATNLGYYVERIFLNGCKFIQAANHSSTQMLVVSYALNIRQAFSRYYSPNLSTTMTTPYNFNQCLDHSTIGTDTKLCYQNNVEVVPTQEKLKVNTISLVGNQPLVITDGGGNRLMSIDGSGNVKIKGTITPSTTV